MLTPKRPADRSRLVTYAWRGGWVKAPVLVPRSRLIQPKEGPVQSTDRFWAARPRARDGTGTSRPWSSKCRLCPWPIGKVARDDAQANGWWTWPLSRQTRTLEPSVKAPPRRLLTPQLGGKASRWSAAVQAT